MYKICCCILLAGLSLSGQTPEAVAALTPAVIKVLVSAGTPDDSVSQALVDDMMSLALQERQPTAKQVVGFVNALRGAAVGRPVSALQVSGLSRGILDVLRRQGISNLALAAQVRTALTELGVGDQKADLIIRQFVALGEAVRGPDDSPANDRIVPLKK